MCVYYNEPTMIFFLLQLVPQHFSLLKNNRWTMLALKIINYNNRFPQHFDAIIEQHYRDKSSGLLLRYAIENQRVYLLRSLVKIENKHPHKDITDNRQKQILLEANLLQPGGLIKSFGQVKEVL